MRLAMVDKTDDLTAEERAGVRQRLRFLLARFSDQVQSVRLVLTRDEGSSVNCYLCRGIVTMRDGRRSEAEDRSEGATSSASRVADRLGRAVARQVECKHPTGPQVARGIQR